MSKDTAKLISLPIFFFLLLIRKPVFWVVVLLLGGLWWFMKQDEVVQDEDNEIMFAQTANDVQFVPTPNGPLPLAEIPGLASNRNEIEPQPFVFSPSLTEAVLSRFRMKMGREAGTWNELRNSGVVSNIPAPPKGFKFVYNEKLGLLEMVKSD